MWKGNRIMKIAPVAEIKAKFIEYVKECKKGAIVVKRNSRPAAALVPVNDDEDLERIIISNSKIFKDIVDGAERRIKSKKKLSHKDFWEQVNKGK